MNIMIDNINKYSNEDYKNFYNLIKVEKQEKIKKLSPIKQKQSILGEILLIKLLNKIGIEYSKISIIYKNNKPYIKTNNVFYNISHSNELVVCVISNKEIGIDIEYKKDINLNISKYFNRDIINNIDILYKTFTLKEAVIKRYKMDILKIKKIDVNKYLKNNLIITIEHNNYILSICKKK